MRSKTIALLAAIIAIIFIISLYLGMCFVLWISYTHYLVPAGMIKLGYVEFSVACCTVSVLTGKYGK
mgnify:CR=1 FL=1